MTSETYARAEALLPRNVEKLIVGGEATPRFLPASDRFRYVERTPDGERAWLVDPDAGTREAAPSDARGPLGAEWSLSPDERWAVRVVDADLWLLDRDSGEERQITHDGTDERPYGTFFGYYHVEQRYAGQAYPPPIAWSPDSRRFVVEQLDESRAGETYLLQVVDEDPRPRLLTFRDAHPEDPDDRLVTMRLHVVDVPSGDVTPVQMDPVPVTLIQPMKFGHVWFSPDGTRIEAVFQSRDQRDLRLVAIDPASGLSRTVAEQRGETVVSANPLLWDERAAARVLDDGRALWFSERDGWGHLWLVDGDEWRQVTRGEWVVRELLHVDEERGEVVFSACGREPGDPPIERRVYRVPLAGGEPELLTPEPLDHEVVVSPSGRWLVDSMSSPLEPTVTVLRDARDGSVARELARADVSRLLEAGWRAPERFTVTSADGETELHGLLYLPPGYDDAGSFPLLDVIYPGPQIGIVQYRFGPGIYPWGFESFSQLGLVVMALNGRGTPMRSKAFQDASYGCLESTPALADHAAAVRQLAERFPGIDVTRVGIKGDSGGGYATARALIEQPETFTVGVSGVGNHDNLRLHAGWGERWIGLLGQDPEGWRRQSNVAVAARLRGKLLLVHAEMDANDNPIHTRALVAALVDADVDHDVLLLPRGDHPAGMTDPYAVRRIWDYLVRHLVGAEPPAYRIDRASMAVAFAYPPAVPELSAES